MNSESTLTQKVILKRDDFTSDQEVRWCPGCGDYAILATVQKTLPLLNIPKENVVFISGIGCSSRFPYYLDTFGFHTIHGRAPTIATGLKMSNPDLTVFVVTGDGDALSIGSNHLLHLMRRNVNVTVLLLNNRIYGLTKGQYSPTSETGKKTKSSPQGSLEQGLDPIQFAIGADCSFIARAMDVDAPGLQTILKEAVAHEGTSFIEIYQNCNVFNDGAFEAIAPKAARAEQTLFLEPGKPMIYGQNQDKGFVWDDATLKSIEAGKGEEASTHAGDIPLEKVMQLASLRHPENPVATGILRQVQRPVYEQALQARVEPFKASAFEKDALMSLFHKRSTWEVTD